MTTIDWTRDAAAHLLRRAGFGGTPVEIDVLYVRGLEGAVVCAGDVGIFAADADRGQFAHLRVHAARELALVGRRRDVGVRRNRADRGDRNE